MGIYDPQTMKYNGVPLRDIMLGTKQVDESEDQQIADLKAQVAEYEKRLCISPQGDDEIDALQEANAMLRHRAEIAEAQVAELEATVLAAYRAFCQPSSQFCKSMAEEMLNEWAEAEAKEAE